MIATVFYGVFCRSGDSADRVETVVKRYINHRNIAVAAIIIFFFVFTFSSIAIEAWKIWEIVEACRISVCKY